jgi:hypothetical protein
MFIVSSAHPIGKSGKLINSCYHDSSHIQFASLQATCLACRDYVGVFWFFDHYIYDDDDSESI